MKLWELIEPGYVILEKFENKLQTMRMVEALALTAIEHNKSPEEVFEIIIRLNKERI